MGKKKILVIVGPTASGKSELAVKLAKKFGGEIISADSRQVYRGLDIGTGKITRKEMGGVPHHLLDVADPKKVFSAADFKRLASNSLQYIVAKQKLPIVVGGTGFYIDALAGKVSLPPVPPNKLSRKKLEKLDNKRLFAMLEGKDPVRARSIDKNNKVRLIRALEIVESLGKVPARQHSMPTNLEFIYIGLKPTNLEKRIENRVKNLFKNGLLKEIEKLKKAGVSEERLKEFGFDYDDPTYERVVSESIKYAKRQRTWFKRNKKIKWFTPDEYGKIEKYVRIALLGAIS